MAQQPMKKADLVATLAERSGVTTMEANSVLNALTDVITEKVVEGGAVMLPGVGKISSRERAARTVRNPQTGESIQKDADRVPRMTFSKPIKDACS